MMKSLNWPFLTPSRPAPAEIVETFHDERCPAFNEFCDVISRGISNGSRVEDIADRALETLARADLHSHGVIGPKARRISSKRQRHFRRVIGAVQGRGA